MTTPEPIARATYAAVLLAEAQSTDNEGVRDANREQAVLCYLAAAEDVCAKLSYAPETLKAIRAAFAAMTREGRSL